MDKDFIFVLMSFRLVESKDHEGEMNLEEGKKYWFRTLEAAQEYLERAGKPLPGEEQSVFHDDPFEYRWNYAVLEKVQEGPMGDSEVMGWYEADFSEQTYEIPFILKILDTPPKPEYWSEADVRNVCCIGI